VLRLDGPIAANPANGQTYGADFPVVTVEDGFDAQGAPARCAGHPQLAAVIAAGLGGMQALSWSLRSDTRCAQSSRGETTKRSEKL